jgi:hypothetical protein
MSDSPLLNALIQVITDYDANLQARLIEANNTINALQAENSQLRQELERAPTLFEEATDEGLQNRLSRLQNTPLDTLIREAGVVLEDRLRQIAGDAGTGKHGVDLVDAVLAPNRGVLQFSQHPGEQDGIRILYRGAMQFVRNPPMHNLIDYQASAAQIQLRLIDTLLRLLAENQVRNADDVNIRDVRRMLKRIPIPPGQKELYQALVKAGDAGLTGTELVSQLNRTRPQIAGVLGALGVRINGTEGLQNKGGILVVFDIERLNTGDYRYKMKPILHKALETERLL